MESGALSKSTAAETLAGSPRRARRIVTERTVIVEAALARTAEILTFAHVNLSRLRHIGKTAMSLGHCPNNNPRRPRVVGRRVGICQLNAI